ncbi:TetR/AcrR family transcriptional regulator [Sinosporangium siamense]|uniref:TetR family transcriptional regulator n=1 Tax=Sinosporangium siamense TaxID=1367973 RepID=A0A919RLY6_9ACTN|nr:TetR/AcrR family transcriptional regulator [Sinosporangium siamense]GII94404.1 TetR family transcriptional regulator [Sinosporangium siamense]
MQSDSRPSGRKRNPIIEEARRRQIIDAAVETVAAVGYAQASLSRIAQHAQISKSVVSYHFAGKDDLLEQVVTQIYDDTWAYIEARLATETTSAGKLHAYIQSNLDYMRSHRSRLLAVGDIVGNHRTADGTPRFATITDESVVMVLTEILRQGIEDGEFRDFDPQVVAVTVGQALIGALGRWALDPGVDLGVYAAELTALFDHATRK